MQVVIDGHSCIVTKEPGDKNIHQSPSSWGDGDSQLLFWVKKELIKQGYDLVKKLMWKDGHATDMRRHYLRTRSPKSPKPHIYIYDPHYDIRWAYANWNERGEVKYRVMYDVFDEG